MITALNKPKNNARFKTSTQKGNTFQQDWRSLLSLCLCIFCKNQTDEGAEPKNDGQKNKQASYSNRLEEKGCTTSSF